MSWNGRKSTPSFYFFLLLFVYGALSSTAAAQKYLFGRADFGAGNAPSFVAVGDFNGDGEQDLAVTNIADNTVSIFLGKRGATFATKVDYPTGHGPTSVTVGDFDGDGKLDLAVTNNDGGTGNSVSILLGNGDGTFRHHVDYSTAFGPIFVVASDLNKDHKLDLVVSTQSGFVSILLGNGNGTFASHVDYPDANGGGGGGSTAVVGDFNKDGKLDLAIADPSDNAVSVLLGNGDGTFQTFIEYATAINPTSVAAGDFNRDGKLDLAVTATVPGTASILLGNGDGTFQNHVDYQVGSTPSFIATADLNGDGKLDLVVDNQNCTNSPCGFGSISILLGNGDGTFQPHVDYGTGTFPSFAIADFNGDGRLDLAIAHQNCIFSPCGAAVSILLGNGNGTFPREVAYAVGTAPGSLATADFNRDGRLDLAVANSVVGTISILLGKGDGTFKTHVDYSTGQNIGGITVGDFNNDGNPDFAVTDISNTVIIFLGKGDGTFQSPKSYATGAGPSSIVAADFNEDGKLDLAVTNSNGGFGNSVSILLGNGDGTFQPHVDYPAGNNVLDLTVGDFNHDGRLDLAVTNNARAGTVSVLLGTGNGKFEAPLTSPAGSSPQSLAVGDFNRDGRLDLAVANVFNPGLLSVLLGNGDGTFKPPVSYATGTVPGSVVAGDLNGDGKIDLAVANHGDNTVSVLLGNGNGTFQPHVDFATGYQPVSAIAADFNRDGGLDLALANVGDNTVSVLLNARVVAIFPTSLNFGSEQVGKTSSPKLITLKNPGSVSLTISAIQITGIDSTDFRETNDCRQRLAVGASCTISTTFTPTSKGNRTGILNVIDNAPSPQRIRLTGVGQ